MAIQLFQEQIPFSNQRLDQPISQSGVYTNPVIMPFAFDFTTYGSALEIVLYIRNNSQQKAYKNVIINLMKRGVGVSSPVIGSLQDDATLGPSFAVNGLLCPVAWSVEEPPVIPVEGINIIGDQYYNTYNPIFDYSYIDQYGDKQTVETDSNINAKFSYGYDELTSVDWSKASSVLVIPSIGTLPTIENPTGMYDISYIPIRMRINWKARTTGTTIRDYFINISYEEEVQLGA